MPVGAMIGSAVIGAGASVYGSSQAAKASKNATQAANDLQRYQYDTTRADQAPWREIGGAAIGALGQGFGFNLPSSTNWAAYGAANPDLQQEWERLVADGTAYDKFGNDPLKFYEDHWNRIGQTEGRAPPPMEQGASGMGGGQIPNFLDTFSEDDFRADPGYQFRLNEGLKAVQGSAAARGALQSGGTLKALTRYAQGTADQTYQDAYNRFNNDRTMIYNRLSNLAGMGQTANNAIAGAGQNYANQVSQNNLNNAAVQAGAATQTAGAIGQFGQNLFNQFGGGYSASPGLTDWGAITEGNRLAASGNYYTGDYAGTGVPF